MRMSRFSTSFYASLAAVFTGFAGHPELPPEAKVMLRATRTAKHKRSWTRARSRYFPHQGKRECARRVRQMANAAQRAARFS